MKFVIALVSYLESLGYDTSSLRKSADGSKAIVHMQYAEILSKNLDTNTNVTIYDRVNPDFQALLASDEWNGNVTGTPNSFGDLAELAKYEARLTAEVTEAKTDMDNFQTEIAGEVTTAKEDLNTIVDNYQVAVNQQLADIANNTELILSSAEPGEDITFKLTTLLAGSKEKIDLGKATFIINSPVVITNKEIFNGTIRLKGAGSIVLGTNARLTNLKILVDTDITSPEAVLVNRVTSNIHHVTVESVNSALRNTVGIRLRGEAGASNCFHMLSKIKIKNINVGLYVDSSLSWITNVTGSDILITDFGDYGFRVGSDAINSNQNSHHNFVNITVQDTKTTVNPRIGFSIGGTWSQYTNLMSFGDGETISFVPFHMPQMTNGSNLLVSTHANSFTNLVVEGNNIKCNGYEYLHNFSNVTFLDSWDKRIDFLKGNPSLLNGSVRVSLRNNTISPFLDNTKVKDAIATSPPPGETAFYLPSAAKTLVDNGSVTFSFVNKVMTVKNNLATDLAAFDVDLYISTSFRDKLKEGRFLTGVFHTGNDVSTTTIQDFFTVTLLKNDGTVLGTHIMHRYLTNGGQLSGHILETTDAMRNSDDGSFLIFRFKLSNLKAGKTYTFRDVQIYNQAVPIINDQTQKLLPGNLMNYSTLNV